MTDPMVDAARRVVQEACETLRGIIDDVPAAALNWLPAGDEDSNSIAVQATHSLSATRYLLGFAFDVTPAPGRDRDAEFDAVASDRDALLKLIDQREADCVTLLDGADAVDWAAVRRRTRSDGSVIELTAAYAVLHALTHLRGHVDEASLTRHLWRAHADPV